MAARSILLYHRIADDPVDPFSLCVTPERFSEQLSRLRDGADVVPLGELSSKRAPSRTSRPRVAVTFDDGYADNLWNALPVADEYGVPITIFVTSRALGRPDGFWWDRLAAQLLGRKEVDLELQIAGAPLKICLHGDSAGTQAMWALHRRLRPLPVSDIEAVVADVVNQLNGAKTGGSRTAVLSHDDLVRLASHPLVDIGAHTTDHALLRRQPVSEQALTITQSKTDLEDVIGSSVCHFAYPFGSRDSFDGRTVAAVRAAGFRSACSTLDGSVTIWSNRFYLPRRMVKDWDLADFEKHLVSWGIG